MITFSVMLAACGGGGGGSDETPAASAQQGAGGAAAGFGTGPASAQGPVSGAGPQSPAANSDSAAPPPSSAQPNQPFTAAVATTGALRVNAVEAGDQRRPHMASLSDGDYVVVFWDTTANAILAQRFNPAGETVGAQLRLDDPIAGRTVALPYVAGTADNGFAVVWQVTQAGGSSLLHTRKVAADGTRVSFHQEPYSSVLYFGIGATPDGGFARWALGSNQAGDTGLSIQRFRADGAEAGPAAILEDSGIFPQATSLANGDLLLTWGESTASGFRTLMRRVTLEGQWVGSPVALPEHSVFPVAAALEGGGWAVIYSRRVPGARSTVAYSQAYSADGTPVGTEKATDLEQDVPVPDCYPAPRNDRSNPPPGAMVCPEKPLHTGMHVTAVAGGGYTVAWSSITRDGQWFVRRYAADGTERSPIQSLGLPTQQEAELSLTAVTRVAGDQIVAGWMARDSDGLGIWVQQFRQPSTP